MARAIVLLVRARALVFLDEVARVLVERKASGKSDLRMGSHSQAIEIKGRLVVQKQRRRALQFLEITDGLRVDGSIVRIGPRRKIDFRPGHAKKAQRIASDQGLRLFGRPDLVRDRGNDV